MLRNNSQQWITILLVQINTWFTSVLSLYYLSSTFCVMWPQMHSHTRTRNLSKWWKMSLLVGMDWAKCKIHIIWTAPKSNTGMEYEMKWQHYMICYFGRKILLVELKWHFPQLIQGKWYILISGWLLYKAMSLHSPL